MTPKEIAWVFVSHASADLPKVRAIRNFMEDRGAGPILFHLRALTHPDEFWPLIEREIAARSFFLLCDSHAARESQWVQREQETVERISRNRPVRIGRVSLDEPAIDYAALERFLRNLSVHIVYPRDHSTAYAIANEELKRVGYAASAWGPAAESLRSLAASPNAWDDFERMLEYSAKEGWLLLLLDNELAASDEFARILPLPSSRKRMMVVLTEAVSAPLDRLGIHPQQIIDGSSDFRKAAAVAAQRMLVEGPD